MAYTDDIYFPATSEDSLLDFVDGAQGNYDPNDITAINDMVDPVTGVTLEDYLIQQRSGGATPSFTDNPALSSIDNFVVPTNPIPAKGVIPLPELDPKLTNIAAATTSAEALNNKRDLDLYIANTMKQLEYDKMEEKGLNDLRKRIETLQSIPGSEEYANPLIIQYNTGLEQVNRDLNSPEMSARWKELGTLSLKWGDKAEELKPIEAADRQVLAAQGILSGEGIASTGAAERKAQVNRSKAAEIIGPELPEVTDILNTTKKDTLALKVAGDPQVDNAIALARDEKLAERKFGLSDIIGRYPKDREPGVIDLVLDRAQRDPINPLSDDDRKTLESDVIAPARAEETTLYAKLIQEKQEEKVAAEKARRGAKKSKAFTPAEKERIGKLTEEEETEQRAIAKARSFNLYLEKYKQRLIADNFNAATDIPEAKALREKYRGLFTYPVNAQNEEVMVSYLQQWRAAGKEMQPYDIKVTLPRILHAAVNNINAETANKIPGETNILAGPNTVINNIMFNLRMGKVDASQDVPFIVNPVPISRILQEYNATPEQIKRATTSGGYQ